VNVVIGVLIGAVVLVLVGIGVGTYLRAHIDRISTPRGKDES
jgi:hypothetical protein